MILELAAFAVWGFIWWRLRGGALTALTGFDPGTNGMRAIAAVAMTLPLLAVHVAWATLILIPAFWLAWVVAGWGAFQDMGFDNNVERPNPLEAVPDALKLQPMQHDLLGMALAGLECVAPLALAVCFLHGWAFPAALSVLGAGLGFTPLYYLAQRILPSVPSWGRFATARSEWAECFVGAWVATIIAWSLM